MTRTPRMLSADRPSRCRRRVAGPLGRTSFITDDRPRPPPPAGGTIWLGRCRQRLGPRQRGRRLPRAKYEALITAVAVDETGATPFVTLNPLFKGTTRNLSACCSDAHTPPVSKRGTSDHSPPLGGRRGVTYASKRFEQRTQCYARRRTTKWRTVRPGH